MNCKYYTERVLGWMLNNKMIVFLGLLSFCLFVSVLAIAGQKNRLSAELEELKASLSGDNETGGNDNGEGDTDNGNGETDGNGDNNTDETGTGDGNTDENGNGDGDTDNETGGNEPEETAPGEDETVPDGEEETVVDGDANGNATVTAQENENGENVNVFNTVSKSANSKLLSMMGINA